MDKEVFFIDFKEDLENIDLANIKAKLVAMQPCAQALLKQKNKKYTNMLPFFGKEGHKSVLNKSSEIIDKTDPISGNKLQLVNHISFVDCPGHDEFMSTMLSGTSIMDAAFLLVGANNTVIPQKQTYEHLMAMTKTNVNDILILQNKISRQI